jgi:hypothetical protein
MLVCLLMSTTPWRLESACGRVECKENDGMGKHCGSIPGEAVFALGGMNGVVMGDVVVGRWS